METSGIDKLITGRVEPQIYVFSTQTVPNYLKVGDTYRPIEQRLNEWRRYFPDLEKLFEAFAKVGKDYYFRDFSIHYYLEHDKHLHRLLPVDIANLPYYSKEFFQNATINDVEEAIQDIQNDFNSNMGRYQFYTFEERPTAITYKYQRGNELYHLRPNQEKTVGNFKEAVKKGRTNLLMYAVMRFGKTFTALTCAQQDDSIRSVLVVSGKADVRDAWKKTTESIKNFEGFDFIDSEALSRNYNIIEETIASGHRAVVFLTLQDLSGSRMKERHRNVFSRIWDLLIVDETHYGARAAEYGKVLKGTKKEIAGEVKYSETADDYDDNKELKQLHNRIRLHLSGTPYRILMGSEFGKEDIIAFYQFSDIVHDKDEWDDKHLNNDDCNEWDNPYFGFPQMIRFAFNVNTSSMLKIKELRKQGVEYALNELLRPQSILKADDGSHLKFCHEKEVLDLLMAIDGSKEDENIFSFLDYDRIKQGKLCRHIVCVLPYRASCDAMEAMINDNKSRFNNLGQYEIINIAGVDDENKYPDNRDVINKISECERIGRKTLTLTVNRMLTGTTVPEWDTMIYLKDTVSPQEYDQATFRLQNQYIRNLSDGKGHTVKYNMKPQTLLVDFEPARMFRMQEAKAQIYNVNTDKRGNAKLSDRIAEELRISPIIVVNKNKMQQVEPIDILNEVKQYSANRDIKDEAVEIPTDDALLDNEEILNALKSLSPIDSKKGINTKAFNGNGEDLDTEEPGQRGKQNNSHAANQETDKQEEHDETAQLEKKLATYYSLILFVAFLTDSDVNSLEDVINAIQQNEDDRRIAKNVGITVDILSIIQENINPFTLRDLDYKISRMHQLSQDDSVEPIERASRAMRKFGRFSESEIVTPSKWADHMVDLLPQGKIKKGTKILDIASKQGEFACALYKKYGDKIGNTIYSLPTSPLAYEFTRKVYSLLGMPICNVIEKYNSYDLIRSENKEKIMEIVKKIDPNIIIGNPPYQDNAVGEQRTFNGPIYNLFMDVSYELSGNVEMIHPARFLANAGSTAKTWNRKMLGDPHFNVLEFHEPSDKVFDNTDIKGGVAISLYETDKKHKPVVLFTRYKELNDILRDVTSAKDFKSMKDIVVTRTAYRFTEQMHEEHPEALAQLSKGHPYDVSTNIFDRLPQIFFDTKPNDGKDYIGIIGRQNNARTMKFVRRDFIRPVENLDYYKIFLPSANSNGTFGEALTPPFIGEPGVGTTETFISIGKFSSEFEAKAAAKYVKTRFARTLLGVLKTTQHLTPNEWEYVPLQNFTEKSDIDWSSSIDDVDQMLFDKYNFSKEERDFINQKVSEMK